MARAENTLPGLETSAAPHQHLSAGRWANTLPLRGYLLLPSCVLLLDLGPTPVPYYRLHQRHSSNCVLPECVAVQARTGPRPAAHALRVPLSTTQPLGKQSSGSRRYLGLSTAKTATEFGFGFSSDLDWGHFCPSFPAWPICQARDGGCRGYWRPLESNVRNVDVAGDPCVSRRKAPKWQLVIAALAQGQRSLLFVYSGRVCVEP